MNYLNNKNGFINIEIKKRRIEITKNNDAYTLNVYNVNSFGNVHANYIFVIRNPNSYSSYKYKGSTFLPY